MEVHPPPPPGIQGHSQDFSKGGGHTVSNIIIMAFSPRNIVGGLLKKGLLRGGHGHPRTPPRYTLGLIILMVDKSRDSSMLIG